MSPWMDTQEGAAYVGFKHPNSRRTINRWIRLGIIPEKFVGQRGKELIVKAEGLDVAVRMIRARRRAA